MSFGMTSAGWVTKTLDEIKKEHESVWKGTYGEDFDISPESPAGQIVAITSESEYDLWLKMEDIVNNQNPMTAYGVGLDLNCSIVGVKRELSKYSYVYGQVFIGSEGTVIPSGTELSVEVDKTKAYKTLASITLGAGVEEKRLLKFSILPDTGAYRLRVGSELTEDINISDSESEIEDKINNLLLTNECAVAKIDDYNVEFNLGKIVLDVFSIYTSTIKDVNQNSVTIETSQIAAGEYQATGKLEAIEKGAKIAFSHSLTKLDNPVSGVLRTFNPEDSTGGSDVESDDELRARRDNSLSTGKATPSAIRTALLNNIPNIDSVKVVENLEPIADAVGRPPHCFETYVTSQSLTNDDIDEIFSTILEYKGAGIKPFGKNTKLLTDVDDIDRLIGYSEATDVNIYLTANLTVGSDYPDSGDTVLKQDIASWGNALGVGKSVIVYPELMRAFDIDGIYNIEIKIGTAVNPTSDANILIGNGKDSEVEVSKWDTSRIIINHV